jgi:hypothetical protein
LKLKRAPWLPSKLRYLLYKWVGIRSGPAMLAVRDEWLYIDFDGKVYRLRPTGASEGSPLTITLEHY